MYEELLDWAGELPLWQQDALRRLAQNGELTADNLTEFQRQVQKEAGFTVEDFPEPVPLMAEHLSQAASNAPKLVLASLGPVQNVDRLSPNQPPLRFAVNGVTAVYGANASGKSGYCRIAKQLCRSQSPVTLRGNAYGGGAQGSPEVGVAFRVGGDGQPKEERIWRDGQDPPAELSRISVFDAATARVYVDKERKIEFLPYELDLMKKLGHACEDLDNTFREHLRLLDAAINSNLLDGFHEGTTVHNALANLVPSTDLSNLPSEQSLRELAAWTAEMQEEFAAAEAQLKQDPQNLIRLRTAAKQALEIVKNEISSIEDNLADIEIAAIFRSWQLAKELSRAASADAKTIFSDQPIPDLGSNTWRKMLIYAREFAAIAFPDKLPPRLANGGLCVLCQQELDEDAVARMSAFDEYISGRASEESTAAAREFDKRISKLMAFSVKSRNEIDTLLSEYAALSDIRRDIAAKIALFVENAGERLEATKSALRDERYDALKNLDPLPSSPAQLLEDEISQLELETAQLNRANRNEEELARFQARHAELSARKQLGPVIESIVERRNHLENRCRFNACRKQCRTGAITNRITTRRRAILTPELKKSLLTELKRLRLTHIPLNLSDRGQKAESIFKIALDTPQQIKKSDILSEGEQRSLALACFLAELREIGSNHAIVVDDPVSSLDHSRMQAVAERLAEEAFNGRQVIVFTHNILFHYMLSTATRRAGVGWHCEWMRSASSNSFGLIDESNQPWQMKNVAQRLNVIDNEISGLIKNGYDNSDQTFRSAVSWIYMKMRETWERIIEEVLFNNAVQRFRPEIMTQRLEAACIELSTDYPAIYEGMKRCSRYSGHDPAPDIPTDLPDSDQIARDFGDLKSFSETAIKRRKDLDKAQSYEKGTKSVLL